MTKITYTKNVKQKVEREVPDYYGCDDTKLGRAVDYLLRDYAHRGQATRDRLYADDAPTVEDAINQLDRAYETARGVAYALGVTNFGAETVNIRKTVPYAMQLDDLRKRLNFILAQDQGCGGNLSEKEIVQAMEHEITKLAQEITAWEPKSRPS